VPLILHVLPYDLARGAQRYARSLVDSLEADEDTHLIVTLFRSDPVLVRPDVELDVRQGLLRRFGLDPRVVIRLRREIRRIRPEVVVAHGGESAKYTSLAAPRELPLIYLKIGSAHESLNHRARKGLHGFYTRRANVIAAVSSDVADEAHQVYGVPRSRLVVLPNGRDPEVYAPGSAEREIPRVIFVGYLDPGKRPDWFIDVVHGVRQTGRDLEAVMVGDGPLEGSLRLSAKEAGIEMLGRREDVPDQLAASDIFVFTSLPPGEGMPGVLIEAGLAGLATVSTKVPGARDVIEDGVTGFIVDIDDKQGMIDAVGRLVGDPALRRSMGEEARARCVKRFTLEASAEQWRDLFRCLDPGYRGRTSAGLKDLPEADDTVGDSVEG
jgi:glycosyltransferase involved in cell wall biosynthesis